MASLIPIPGTFLLVIGAQSDRTRFPLLSPGNLHPSELRVETLVGSLALWLGAAVLIWWALSMTMAFLAAVSQLRGRARSAEHLSKWAPTFMRRLALAVLGLNLLVAPAAQADSMGPASTQAHASAGLARGVRQAESLGGSALQDRFDPGWVAAAPVAGQRTSDAEDALDPGWTPPVASLEPGHLAAAPRSAGAMTERTSFREVEVKPGDTLWSLAARELGPHASELDIALAWPQWFELNRNVIGRDPDLLLPGTVLTVPAPA